MWILVADDEPWMGHLLTAGLTDQNHTVTLARDGEEAYAAACASPFDILILDVMMPALSGIQLTRRLRSERNTTPVLLLTARDAASDVVLGLDAGADDYLVKPFEFSVLLARLRAIARRREGAPADVLSIGDLTIDLASRQVTRSQTPIPLTATEYRILEFLTRRAGRAVSRNALIEAVWGFDGDVESNTLDVNIKTLRAKLDLIPSRKLIHTLRGFGYILRE